MIRHLAFGLAVSAGVWGLMIAPSHARIRKANIDMMVSEATHIVVGRVVEVFEVNGAKVATIERIDTLRGETDPGAFTVLVERLWTEDLSDAKLDEVAVFFLRPLDTPPSLEGRGPVVMFGDPMPEGIEEALTVQRRPMPLMVISWAGLGRMPIVWTRGREYATIQMSSRLAFGRRVHLTPLTGGYEGVLLSDLIPLIETSPATLGSALESAP